jgi:hypothetical protein
VLGVRGCIKSLTLVARWLEYMFISEDNPHRFCKVELGTTFNSKSCMPNSRNCSKFHVRHMYILFIGIAFFSAIDFLSFSYVRHVKGLYFLFIELLFLCSLWKLHDSPFL